MLNLFNFSWNICSVNRFLTSVDFSCFASCHQFPGLKQLKNELDRYSAVMPVVLNFEVTTWKNKMTFKGLQLASCLQSWNVGQIDSQKKYLPKKIKLKQHHHRKMHLCLFGSAIQEKHPDFSCPASCFRLEVLAKLLARKKNASKKK